MRFRIGTQVLNIEAVIDVEQRGETTVLNCLERKAGT
jgi:head-tail adaptor